MSPSKKSARRPENTPLGPYGTALALLFAGTAAQALGMVALALVSRRVLDEGGGPWIWILLALAVGVPLLSGGMNLLSGRTVDRAAASLRRDTLKRLLRKDAALYRTLIPSASGGSAAVPRQWDSSSA